MSTIELIIKVTLIVLMIIMVVIAYQLLFNPFKYSNLTDDKKMNNGENNQTHNDENNSWLKKEMEQENRWEDGN